METFIGVILVVAIGCYFAWRLFFYHAPLIQLSEVVVAVKAEDLWLDNPDPNFIPGHVHLRNNRVNVIYYKDHSEVALLESMNITVTERRGGVRATFRDGHVDQLFIDEVRVPDPSASNTITSQLRPIRIAVREAVALAQKTAKEE